MAERRLLAFSIVNRGLILGAIWLVLTGASLDGLIFGAFAVPAAVWLSLTLLPPSYQLGILRLVAILPRFIARSVAGGLDVAWRAVQPRLPIAPGWITVPVTLPDGARVALGAELSLMPGTLVAGTQEGKLLVHVLDREADHSGIARTEQEIAALIGLSDKAP